MGDKVLIILLDGTIQVGDVNMYNRIYTKYQDNMDFFLLDEELNIGVEGLCGFRFVDEQDALQDNPYRSTLNIKVGGNYLLFKSTGNKPELMTKEEAEDIKYWLELDTKFKLKESNYLLTTVGGTKDKFKILPAEEPFTFEDYSKYYLEEPQQLELLKLSKKVGTQVTMWVSKKDQPYKDGKDYNNWASKVVSNELDENIRVYYETILTKRVMKKGIIEEFIPLTESEIKNIIMVIKSYEEYTLSNYTNLKDILN